jgi:hypothetical protein
MVYLSTTLHGVTIQQFLIFTAPGTYNLKIITKVLTFIFQKKVKYPILIWCL